MSAVAVLEKIAVVPADGAPGVVAGELWLAVSVLEGISIYPGRRYEKENEGGGGREGGRGGEGGAVRKEATLIGTFWL